MSKILLLTESDLKNVLKPEELIRAMEDAFSMYSENRTVMPLRTVMWVEGNWWGVMEAYVPRYGVGVKVVNVIPANLERGLPTIHALVSLYDPETGAPLAVMEGKTLTAMRTAAACAVSIKYMAPERRGDVALIGAGFQARYMLRFASKVFKVEKVRVYDVRREALESFREEMSKEGYEITTVSSPSEAAEGAKLIMEATTAKEPVVSSRDLKPPVHLVSIGVVGPDVSVLGEDLFAEAEVVAVDSKEAVMGEVADLRVPVEKGLIKLDQVVELGEVIIGKKPGRVGEGITLFKSVGLAIQDACAAGLAYEKALKEGIGTVMDL